MRTIAFFSFGFTMCAVIGLGGACGPSTSGTCDETSSCAPSTDGGEDGFVPPADCEMEKEPKESPACVDDGVGIFVDGARGDDGNAGTKGAPKKTVNAALSAVGGKPRVYVCAGEYVEAVKVTSGVSLYGGFACGAWTYTGNKAKVTSPAGGYALEIANVASAVTVADMALEAGPGSASTPSSVAVFAHGAAGVTFLRASLTAHAGAPGAQGDTGATGIADKALDGDSANNTTPGALKTCTCSSGASTTGGNGGAAGGDGQNGAPNIPENPTGKPTPKTGHGGTNALALGCVYPGGLGLPGADAASAADAPAVTTLGTVDETGWHPASGGAGRRTAIALSDALCVKRHRTAFLKLIKSGIGIVFANETEAKALYDTQSLDDALQHLRADAQVAVVTRSEKGSLILAGEEAIQVSPERVDKVVDATGAGELYAAGFLYGLSHGMSLKASGRLGAFAAAEVLGVIGARPQQRLAHLAKMRGLL